jgi:SAM-dependent methyltransferase
VSNATSEISRPPIRPFVLSRKYDDGSPAPFLTFQPRTASADKSVKGKVYNKNSENLTMKSKQHAVVSAAGLSFRLMVEFKDYFSGHSKEYSKYRPSYPAELFEYLASIAPANGVAWDCATGNGQAAHGLAAFFERVIATDASSSQLRHAAPHDRVEYVTASASQTNIERGSIDLVTVAQAFHWLELESFYKEVNRVLKKRGAIAVWCYGLINVAGGLDQELETFYKETVGPYWAPERELVDDGYRKLPFPFRELNPPGFDMKILWTFTDLLGYLRTWSATQSYMKLLSVDPVAEFAEESASVWGDPAEKRWVRWPLSMRVGIRDL